MSQPPTAQYWINVVLVALTVWREARGESDVVKLAVAYSILTRAKGPTHWWGTDVQSVIAKRYQYSSMTVAGDPNLVQWPLSGDPSWDESMQAAQSAIGGTLTNPAPGADSYFDDSIDPPRWTQPPAVLIAKIGRMNFYRTVALG